MSEWQYYNPSPVGRQVGDCSVRALSKAIGTDWDRAYVELALMGFMMKNMPDGNEVINAVLKQYGFVKQIIPNTCPECYTVKEFADEHPHGTYVVGTGNHVVCIDSGTIFDSWDSSNEIAIFFWEEEPEDPEAQEEQEEKKDGI